MSVFLNFGHFYVIVGWFLLKLLDLNFSPILLLGRIKAVLETFFNHAKMFCFLFIYLFFTFSFNDFLLSQTHL